MNKSKTINLIVCVLVLSFLIFNHFNSYGEGTETLQIAGDKNFPPYEFVDEDGEYKGFNVDLMRAIALELKKDIKFYPMDWLAAHAALINGKVDLIQGMNFNKQRKEIYDFSTPYILNASVVFTRKDDVSTHSLNDLKGKIVAVQRSDFTAYILAEQGEIEVKFVSELITGFNYLIQGKVDAVFSNKLTGIYVINNSNLNNMVKIVGDEINQMDYGVAVKKGNDELLSQINEALSNLKKKGTYSKIYEKWFGTYEDKGKWQKEIIYIILSITLLSFIFSYVNYRWNKELKKEVDKRTTDLSLANMELTKSKNLIIESNKFKEQIIDSLSIGLITFDSRGYITAFNKSALQIFSMNREDVLGRTLDELNLDKFFNISLIYDCIKYGKSNIVEETRFVIDGEEYFYNYIISPLITIEEKMNGGVMTFRNFTDEKNMRNELQHQSKMQSLGRLVAGIVHEIRNPLTSIKTYIDLLPEKYDNVKFREKITRQVPMEIDRLNVLLKELLDYSKPSSNIVEEFSLNKLAYETIDLVKTSYENKHINITVNSTCDIIIKNEMNKMRQVLINILLNSFEAINNDGHIDIYISKDCEYVYMEIKDDGVGVDEKSIDKIFEPFYTTKQNGTGLGLALCYQYINEMQGSIKVSSNDNGTIVYISIRLIGDEGFDD